MGNVQEGNVANRNRKFTTKNHKREKWDKAASFASIHRIASRLSSLLRFLIYSTNFAHQFFDKWDQRNQDQTYDDRDRGDFTEEAYQRIL
jgi:hypothetical protein